MCHIKLRLEFWCSTTYFSAILNFGFIHHLLLEAIMLCNPIKLARMLTIVKTMTMMIRLEIFAVKKKFKMEFTKTCRFQLICVNGSVSESVNSSSHALNFLIKTHRKFFFRKYFVDDISSLQVNLLCLDANRVMTYEAIGENK